MDVHTPLASLRSAAEPARVGAVRRLTAGPRGMVYPLLPENSEVRVTSGSIGSKEGTPLHERSLNRVFVCLTKMDFRVVPEGKKPEHAVQKECAAAWGPPIRHTECNLSGKRFEAVVIEPKY
jgi:hypothetical protein